MTEPAASCPICGRPMVARFRPFCSARCAEVDLQRWFSGAYAVPAEEGDERADETPDLAGQPEPRSL